MAVLGRSRSGAPPLIKSWIRPCEGNKFFIIFVKYDCYNSGSGAQVLVVIYFKLHWF